MYPSEEEIQRVCTAISFTIADWPDLFRTSADVLEHWLFVIGNGHGFDEETSSLIVDGIPLHKYPDSFDLYLEKRKRFRKWARKVADWASFCKSIEAEVSRKDKRKRLAEHCFKNLTPHDLNKNSLLKDICRLDPKRAEFARLDLECQYKRPYPLCEFSKVAMLTGKSPPAILWVAQQFCLAWAEFLQNEIEKEHFFHKGYAGREWTIKHMTEIKSYAEKLEGFLSA